MKVADLRKYRKNVEALEAINRLLAERVVVDSVQGSHGYPDYAIARCRIEGIPPTDRSAEALQRTKRTIEREQAAIRLFISGIKERRIYEALFYYCIDGELNNPTWEMVAEKMGESNAESVRKCAERHLEKFFQNVRLFP